jgi:hypothetical protein
MPNRLSQHRDLLETALWWGVALVGIGLICLRLDFGSELLDLFQEGEYLAGLTAVDHSAQYGFPYLPHGLLDLWPSWAATQTCGVQSSLGCTRAYNAALTALSMVALIGCILTLTERRSGARPLALASAAILFVVMNAQVPGHVQLQQGAPGVRDLVFLLQLFCMFTAGKTAGLRSNLALVGAGLLAGLGVFWCYNRGIIGVGVLGAYLLLFAVLRRRPLAILYGGVAVVLCLGAFFLFDPVGSAGHMRNIIYWATLIGGGAGGAPPAFSGQKALLAAYLVSAIAIVALLIRNRKRGEIFAIEVGLTLIVIFVGYTLGAVIRPDPVHVSFGLPPVLLAAALIMRMLAWERPMRNTLTPTVFLLGAAGLMIICVNDWAHDAVRDGLRNLSYVARGMPRNDALVSASYRPALALLRQTKQPCTFTFDNGSAIYALAKTPSCSSFQVPYAASPAVEGKIMGDLARGRPKVIVWSSTRWFSHTDGGTPADRMPQLAAWVRKTYPYSYDFGEVTLRSSEPIAKVPGAKPAFVAVY